MIEGHNGQEMINGESLTIGYRGVGYNPNFAHADEFPPSQEHVQTEEQSLDLSKHISGNPLRKSAYELVCQ
jgi:hypothetical protein